MPFDRIMKFTVAMPATILLTGIAVWAQAGAPPNSQPNPYRTVENWFKLPEGRTWGSASAIDIECMKM